MVYSSIITQCIALFVSTFLLIIWSLHKKLNSEGDTIFLGIIVVALLSELLDIGVQVCPINLVMSGINVSNIVLRLYLVTIPLCVILISIYVNFSVLTSKQFKRFRLFVIVAAAINSLIIFFLPSSLIEQNGLMLPQGIATLYTYIQCAVIAFALVIELFITRKKIHRATFIANLVWLFLFMAAGVLQFIFLPTLGIPIISFVISLGTLAVYLIFENPGNRYDYQNYRFHYETFVKYISESIKFDEIQSVLYINLATKNNVKLNAVSSAFSEFIKRNRSNPEIKIFKGIGNELLITSKELVILQEIAATTYEIINITEKNEDVKMYASVVIVPSISKIKTYRILRDILDEYKIKGNLINDNIQFFTVKDNIIERCNKDAIVTADIDYAIKNDLINIKFQALNSIVQSDKKIFEIITTLKNSEGKELYPNDYSRVANKTNKFIQIDEHSFEKVCFALDNILSKKNCLDYILIRISVQALEEEVFLDRVVESLRRHDIPYRYICFEITNANVILKKDILLKNITYMQRLGISFAMGGFGSGESNLNYFIDLPMNIVKFDQSILKNAVIDPKAALIMKDVTELAHSLGFKVIAVGAKTEEEVKFVRECGIELAIGDQFASILDENEFVRELTLNGGEAC